MDTENTRVTAIASGSCPFGEDPERILEALVGEFLGRIASAFPIRGRVTEVQSGVIGLNVAAPWE